MKNDLAGAESSGRRNDSTFNQVLDEIVRSDDPERRLERTDVLHGHSFATFAPPMQSGDGREYGPTELWDQALEWIGEPQDAARAPSDNANSIAAELGLTDALTHDELNRARRQFMWNNHPDRRPDVPRELANRRVAIANMLIDRAHAALTERRRAP